MFKLISIPVIMFSWCHNSSHWWWKSKSQRYLSIFLFHIYFGQRVWPVFKMQFNSKFEGKGENITFVCLYVHTCTSQNWFLLSEFSFHQPNVMKLVYTIHNGYYNKTQSNFKFWWCYLYCSRVMPPYHWKYCWICLSLT